MEAKGTQMLGPTGRGWAHLGPCLGHLDSQPPAPGFLQLWGGAVSQADWFLAALVTASFFEPYLHSGLRSTKGPQGFPLSKESSPPPGLGKEADKPVLGQARAGRQGLLSGLPSGICIPVGSPVGRARRWRVGNEKGHYLLRHPRAGEGWAGVQDAVVTTVWLPDFDSAFSKETMIKMWDKVS